MASTPESDGFLSRWSRRKALARDDEPLAEPAGAPADPAPAASRPAPAAQRAAAVLAPVRGADGDLGGSLPDHSVAATGATPVAPGAPPPAPTLADVTAWTPEADFSRFVATDVDPAVKNAALKKLFTDPHYNVMDGLDTYIEDYGLPDPIPPAMLRQLVQGEFLGLFREEREAEARAQAEASRPADAHPTAAALDTPAADDTLPPPPALDPTRHDHADLRLQPDDAAGRPGPGAGPGPQPGR
jgi:Protein of unknown function (DUF3306)